VVHQYIQFCRLVRMRRSESTVQERSRIAEEDAETGDVQIAAAKKSLKRGKTVRDGGQFQNCCHIYENGAKIEEPEVFECSWKSGQ
jgi:hypothetical protein